MTIRRTESNLEDFDPERAKAAKRGEIKLMTYNEASCLLGVAVTTVRKMIKSGELPSMKIGRRVIIPLSGLLAYVNGNTTGGLQQ